jgi:uncharacterized secreted protein with C-terminal beta-propeller domain
LRLAAPCRRVLRPARFSGTDVLTVLTIDLDKGLPAVDSDAIMSGGQVVYASGQSLYVATQKWTPEAVSPQAEPPSRSFTTIHRFATADPDSTSYRASGEVPGYLLNQFSMSEHEGMLRAASTETPLWWPGLQDAESQSFVTVLDERDGALVQVGQVGGLGRGERIYAVRFLGDVGYVVTFRQTDPLYTVDLSDSAQPRVRGELKIPGYSAYLHPIGEDLLLGVGQEATLDGRVQGLQLSLFDVSDLAHPVRMAQLRLGDRWSQSAVEWDHHAFLWWPATKLAVLPMDSQAFQGALGFRVGRAGGIAEVGRVTHPAGDASWTPPVSRAVVVGDRLFTISDLGIKASGLGDFGDRGWVAFPQPPEPPCCKPMPTPVESMPR